MIAQKVKAAYVRTIYILCYLIPTPWMRARLPVERLILPINKTTKQYYLKEKLIYRYTCYLQENGYQLTERDYNYMKLIAEKYRWPYIKEVYDV